MPKRGVPTVLIDGPSAGQFLYTDPSATAWRVARPIEPIPWTPTMDYSLLFPEPTTYRFESRTAGFEVPGSAEPAWLRLRFGWSEPGDPDERAIRRYGRAALVEHPELMPRGAVLWPGDPEDDEPIRVLVPGDGPVPFCRDEFQMEPDTRLMRGVCPCGWRTEVVESRRLGELQVLTAAHGRAGMEALRALIERGVVSFATPPSLASVVDAANRHADERGELWRSAEAHIDWGAPLHPSDADWPAQGNTCAHICGADPDHACDARATTRLTYTLPSGGTRSMPICGPCYASETAVQEKEHVDA